MKKSIIVSLGWALCLNFSSGQEYQGAEAILQAVAEASGQESKPAKKQNAVTALQAELIKFREQAKTMPPAEAASKWVAFLEAYLMIPQEVFYQDSDPDNRFTIHSLITALPPSQAWNDIKTQLTERSKKDGKISNQALEVFANVLTGDAAAVNQNIQNIKDALKKQKNLDQYQQENFKQILTQIQQALVIFSGDVAQQITVFKEQLDELEKNQSRDSGYPGYLELPPLLRNLSKEETETLLQRVWKVKAQISCQDKETRQFAVESALKQIDSISTPPWGLISDVNDAPLFEALYKKFEDKLPKDDYSFARAKGVYLVSLIIANKNEKAAGIVLEETQSSDSQTNVEFDFGSLSDLQQKGYGKQVVAFLQELLNKNAGLPLWNNYIELSALEGMSDKALEFQETILRSCLVKIDVSDDARYRCDIQHCF